MAFDYNYIFYSDTNNKIMIKLYKYVFGYYINEYVNSRPLVQTNEKIIGLFSENSLIV